MEGHMLKLFTPFVISLAGIPFLFSDSVFAGDIIAEWDKVTIPVAPKLQSVSVDHSSTALLILDIEERTCNQQRRPRCLDTVPKIAALLEQAKAKK